MPSLTPTRLALAVAQQEKPQNGTFCNGLARSLCFRPAGGAPAAVWKRLATARVSRTGFGNVGR